MHLQKKVDATFVIGDKISSNANKLFQILKKKNENTYFIENIISLKKLVLPFSKYNAVQIVSSSSSSTPAFIENQIFDYLQTL